MEKKLEKINTTRFGEVEVDNSLLFNFVSPIIGYNDKKQYTLIDYRPDSPFKWLQSMEDMDLAFPVTLCSYFNIDYQFEIPTDKAEKIDLNSVESLISLNIVTIPVNNPKKATINLLAPIIINATNMQGMQLILSNSNYPVKHPLFKEETVN